MNSINYDSSSVTDINFPGFDEYEIISGHDCQESSDGKVQSTDSEGGDNSDYLQASKSSPDVYAEEWGQLFNKNLNLDELKKKCLDGELRSSRFRSICWRCMLGILHSEPNQWLLELQTYRSHYTDLWVELQKNPWNVEGRDPSDNPLSQEAESIWQKYFSNEELKSVIHQDVVRTFPGVTFFRTDTIQELMVRILFCYARQNPSLCYRQGMHEILAPLIFVLHCDYQALQCVREQSFLNNDISEILDPKYIEEDAYSLFKHVMNHIECSYRIKNVVPTATGYFTSQVDDDKNCENEVISRLQYIKDNILQTSDPDLNKHLDELDIPLHLFGMWLRLLFGREFPFQDLLVLWDAIFAISNFELVNYIVVAMLTAIRAILLVGDYTTCLKNLMRYPSGVDVMFVIEYALHLMDPSLYAAPTVTSFVNKPVTLLSKTKCKNRIAQNSENCDASLQGGRLKILPSKPTKWLPGKSHSLALAGSGEGDGSIVEGYPLDDPKVLRSDLENLTSAMGVIHSKLSQYYNILNNNLSDSCNTEVRQALEGMKELCSLVKTYQSQAAYADIEPAFEADETRHSLSARKKPNSAKKPGKPANAGDLKANTLPKAAKKVPAGELRVIKQWEVGPIVGAPMTDPLRLMKKESGECQDDDKTYPEDRVD